MGWILGIGIPALYLFIGFRFFAPLYVKREVESTIRSWGLELLEFRLQRDPNAIEEWRRDAAFEGFIIGLVWPFYGLARLISQTILSAVPLSSYEIRQQNETMKRRIAELEKEIGIQ